MLLIHAESQCYLQNFSFVISLSPKATNTMQSRIPLVYVKRPFLFLCYYCLKRDRISHLKFWGLHMSSAKRSWRSWGGDATKKSVKNPSGLHCVLRCCPHKHNWIRNFKGETSNLSVSNTVGWILIPTRSRKWWGNEPCLDFSALLKNILLRHGNLCYVTVGNICFHFP